LENRRARVLLVEVDDEAGVDRRRPVLGREDRVEVDLGDLREVGDELGDRLDDVRQALDVHARAAADAVEDLRGADAVDHLERGLARDRREAERHVAQDLDEDAAEAERHDRAERRVLDRADEHLGALRQHLLDLHAGDPRVGLVGLRVLDDGVEALADLVARAQADEHALGLRLVEDVGRDDLGDHGIAHVLGQGHRLVRGRGEPLARYRDAVCVGDALGLRCAQRLAAVGADLVEHLADRCLVAGRAGPVLRRGRSHQTPSSRILVSRSVGVGRFGRA